MKKTYSVNGYILSSLDDARRQAIGDITFPRKERVEILAGSDSEGWELFEFVERNEAGRAIPSWGLPMGEKA